MSTIEKLFLQTFERKKRIIEQAKHQTDLFDQHLASICLLDGVAPPPWLWSPSFPSFSSDPKVTELKEEELISELLLPRPQLANPCSSSHYSLYQKPIVRADNKRLTNVSCTEVHASNNGTDVGDRLSVLPPFPTDDAQDTFNGVPEPDVSVTSPQDCVDAKLLDNGPDHPQSLVKIQRSKSRQKALEIRNSARASKSHSCDKNYVGVTTSQGLGSGILSLQYDHVDKSELVIPVDTNTKDCEEAAAKIGESGGKKKISDIDYRRTTRSGKSTQQNSFTNDLRDDGNSSYVAQDDGPTQSMNDLIQLPNHLNELSELVNSTSLAKASFTEEDADVVQCRGNEINTNIFSDRITRSRSFISQANTSNKALEVGNYSCVVEEDDGHREPFDKSGKQCNSVGELLPSVKASSVISNESIGSGKGKTRGNRIKGNGSDSYGGRITRSRSINDRRITRSTSSNQQPNCVKGCLKLDNSCGNDKEDAVSNAKQLSNHVDNITELVKPLGMPYECCGEEAKARDCQKIDVGSDNYCHRTTNSSSTGKFSDVNFPEVVISSDIVKVGDDIHAWSFGKSSQLPQKLSFVQGVNLEVLSGTQSNVLPCTESIIAETDIDHNGLVVACLGTSVSKSDGSGHGEEVLESRSPSECAMLVKPRQLDFNDVEESSLLETSDPALNNKQEGTSEKLPSSLLHSTDLLYKETSIGYQEKPNPSIEMPLLENWELSGEKEKAQEDSSKAHMQGDSVLVDESIINFVQQKFISQNRNANSNFMSSWPQHKRIKLGGQLTNSLSASRSLDRKSYQPIYMHHMEDAEQLDVGKSQVEDPHWNMEHQKIEDYEVSSSKLLVEEVASSLEESGRNASTAFILMPEQQGVSSVSSLKKLTAGVPQDCFMEKTEVAVFDVTGPPTAEENQVLFQPENKLELGVEVLTCTEDTMQEKKYIGEDNLSYCSFGSPRSQTMVGAEQNMPEFEGFVMETDNEQPCTGNEGINFDKLNLPPTALGRASVLEQLFKSTTLHTPLSHFSATYKLHNALNLFQSIPNGLLEGMELRSALNMNGVENEQLGGSCSCLNEEVNHTLHGRSHSVSLPFSNAHPVWDCRKPYMSPVGKLWDGIPLKSGSSGKRVSSIPELPSINEENENTDGVPDLFLESIVPEDMISSVKRQPLADITKNSKSQMSVCEAEMNVDRHSLASMKTEFNFSGTCDRAKKKGNQNSNKRRFTSKDKENQNLSLGGDGVKRGKESVHSRFSKPKLSGKTGFRKGGPSLSEKESKRTNIVSNITSFIPLVQQTQAAAVITEKRNIKVKALEAAEAAKRLAEKKENERKMRKEALKIERARMEEQNLRQLEQEKKKKEEEEQKKKEADMVSKKRQREQEEKKEKERKRKRVEEVKRQQQEHEKKLRAEKVEKQVKFQAPGGRASARNETKDRLGKNEKFEKAKGDINPLTVPYEPKTNKVSTIDTTNASIIPQYCEALSDCGDNSKVTGYFYKASDSGSVISNTSREQSYDISPYKGSDDEDEDEDDDAPNTKFVPSWASKSQLAVLASSQQRIDPESIFPPVSFCSISEVLLPRQLQQKQ